MKISLLKKIVALGLSLCTVMSLATSAFASGISGFVRAKTPGITYFFDVYRLTGYYVYGYDIAGYSVVGLKTENVYVKDVSRESLKKTEITGEDDISVRIYNPCCSIKIMFAFAALYVLGYSKTKIINFILRLAENEAVEGNIPLYSLYLGVKDEFNKILARGKDCKPYRLSVANKICEEILVEDE